MDKNKQYKTKLQQPPSAEAYALFVCLHIRSATGHVAPLHANMCNLVLVKEDKKKEYVLPSTSTSVKENYF